jgi:uncharacterized protein YndB with AHSA1/START domain
MINMRHDLILSRSIEISETPAKVWNTLTNPELIKEYLFGTETVTDWKEGSEIIFQGEYQGHKYRDQGIILKNVLEELLSYSYWSGFSGLEDKPENYSEVTYELSKIENNHTKLKWTQKGYANEEGYKHSESVIEGLLNKIKEIAER